MANDFLTKPEEKNMALYICTRIAQKAFLRVNKIFSKCLPRGMSFQYTWGKHEYMEGGRKLNYHFI